MHRAKIRLGDVYADPFRIGNSERKCRLLGRGDFARLDDARAHHGIVRRQQIGVLELLLHQGELRLIGAQLRFTLRDVLRARTGKL